MAIFAREVPDLASRLSAGALTGAAGGLLMAAYGLIYHGLVSGLGVFTLPNLLATAIGYPMHYDFGVYTLVGVILHMGFSVILGLLWGWVFVKTPEPLAATLFGLVYGYLLYALMFAGVMSGINPWFANAQGTIMLLAHLVFGTGFGLYPLVVDNMIHEPV